MRCAICDKELSDKEVIWNSDLKGYEPCTVCLDAAMDAAYPGGVPDEGDEELILVSDFDNFAGDGGDIIPRYNAEDDYE